MKKLFILIIILTLIPAAAISANDFGGSLQNFTNLNLDLTGDQTADLGSLISQNDKVTLWFNLDFSRAFNIVSQLGWIFRYENTALDFYYDFIDFKPLELLKTLETIKFKGEIGSAGGSLSMFGYQAGRYHVSDPSGLIINSTLDGLDILFRFPQNLMRFGIWYNGFIDKNNSTILISRADTNSYLDNAKTFASPRLIEYAELKINDVTGQTFTFFMAAQEDLYLSTRLEELDSGRYFSGYLGGDISGSITPSLFYSLTGIFNGGLYMFSNSEESKYQLAQLYEIDIKYLFDGFMSPILNANLIYSTGDDWGRSDWEGSSFSEDTTVSTMFTPISANTFGYIYKPKLGNMCILKAEYSIKPVRQLQLILNNTMFFRTVDGPISLDTTAGVTDIFLGDEVSLKVNFRPLSDFGISSIIGLFYPNELLVTSHGMEFRVDIYFSIDF